MPRKSVNTNKSPRRAKRIEKVLEVPRIQKEINNDYRILARDYRRLALNLWNKPATRYVLGGVAAAALVPVAMRVYRRYPGISTFFTDSLDVVERKFSGFRTFATDMMSSSDNSSDAHH